MLFRLVQILLKDPEPMLFHAEIVHRNGKPVGYVRAGSYGFTLGAAVGLAMIEADEPVNPSYLKTGEWEVEIAGKCYPAQASLRPLYDPKMERVKSLAIQVLFPSLRVLDCNVLDCNYASNEIEVALFFTVDPDGIAVEFFD